MKNFFNLSVIVLFFLSFSCQSGERLTVLDIDQAVSSRQEEMLSNVASSISYLLLETTEESLLDDQSIHYIGQLGPFLLIADKNSCYLFDRDGNFVRKIGRQGKGPGEYLNVRTVSVDERTQHVYISHNGTGILEYDMQGNYIRTLLPDAYLGHWAFLNENIVVDLPNYRGDNPYKLEVVTQKGDTIARILNYDLFAAQGRPLQFDNNPFFVRGDELNYHRIFNDTIYTISPSSDFRLDPKYVFQSVRHTLEKEIRMDATKFTATTFDFVIPWSLLETDDYLFVNAFRNKSGLVPFLYQKSTGSFAMLASPDEEFPAGLQNDLDGGLPFFPEYRLSAGSLCKLYPTYMVLDYIEKTSWEHRDIPSDITENSNPVLAIVHLR